MAPFAHEALSGAEFLFRFQSDHRKVDTFTKERLPPTWGLDDVLELMDPNLVYFHNWELLTVDVDVRGNGQMLTISRRVVEDGAEIKTPTLNIVATDDEMQFTARRCIGDRDTTALVRFLYRADTPASRHHYLKEIQARHDVKNDMLANPHVSSWTVPDAFIVESNIPSNGDAVRQSGLEVRRENGRVIAGISGSDVQVRLPSEFDYSSVLG